MNEYVPPEGVQRRTKIVATIGPGTQSVEMLEELVLAGVNIIRMNFSHGDHEVLLYTLLLMTTMQNSGEKNNNKRYEKCTHTHIFTHLLTHCFAVLIVKYIYI